MRRFGFCLAAWTRAVARGEVTARPATKALGVVLVSRSSRWFKKAKLLKEGRFENRCCCCGLDSWLGKPLSIQIDHINGKNDDWRIENLRMLCPNCHSQTPTFAGRNQKRATQLPEQPKVM
jgi:5-methylcytosine-specific restriction endonuclease McrA